MRALKKARWLLIIGRSPALANMIQMNSKLGGVERSPFAKVFPGSDDLVPRFECHGYYPSFYMALELSPHVHSERRSHEPPAGHCAQNTCLKVSSIHW